MGVSPGTVKSTTSRGLAALGRPVTGARLGSAGG
jgi:DNA-directed RNA polymerase specialized sigma24 family protein